MIDLAPLFRFGVFVFWAFIGSFVSMVLALFGVYWMYALAPFIMLAVVGILHAWSLR